MMFEFILENLTDEKPKVRKQANKSMSSLIDVKPLTKGPGSSMKITLLGWCTHEDETCGLQT